MMDQVNENPETHTLKTRIGVAGCGVVGSAIAKEYEERSYEVVRYDVKTHPDTLNELRNCDIVFIAVSAPTNPDMSVDTSNVEDVISKLSYDQIAVIRSTVPPGTTKRIFNQYKGLKRIIHSPEFLTANNPMEGVRYPERTFYGLPHPSLIGVAEFVESHAPFFSGDVFYYDSDETELIKYASNTFLAMKVVYSNLIHDIAQSYGISDPSRVLNGMGTDSRIGLSHTTVDENGRGAGGMCFPKDLYAFIRIASAVPSADSLLRCIRGINDKYLYSSKKDLDILEKLYPRTRVM